MLTAQLQAPIDLTPSAGAARVAPAEFRIFVSGENGSDQGTFLFDEPAAAEVMTAFRARGRDLVIDYEHASMEKPPIKALAAGWMQLSIRAGELWATEVRWLEDARREIAAAAYRYISPAFRFERGTRRITEVLNVSLTNNPSLYSLPALVAASSPAIRNPGGAPVEHMERKYKSIAWRRDPQGKTVATLCGSNGHQPAAPEPTITAQATNGEIVTVTDQELAAALADPDKSPGPGQLDRFAEYIEMCAGWVAEARSARLSGERVAFLRGVGVPRETFHPEYRW